jgi:lysophospholipase L1-like esterase
VAIDNLITKRHEVVHTFGWYMRKMIAETKAKGATPIVLSLSVRNLWKDGQIERGSGRYGTWSAQLAREAGVRFIDLTNLVADSLQRLGPERTKAMYVQDYVHFNATGCRPARAHRGVRAEGTAPECSAAHMVVGEGRLRAARPARRPGAVVARRSLAPDAVPRRQLDGAQWPRRRRGRTVGVGRFRRTAVRHDEDQRAESRRRRTERAHASSRRATGIGCSRCEAGDFVMVEFGHNDASPVNDTLRARGVLRGIGRDSVIVDNLITKQKGEVVYSFGEYLRKFAREARARGATPIINSLTPRKFWKDGASCALATDSRTGLSKWRARKGVAFVNLTELASAKMDTMPPARVDSLFGDANLHSSARGAELNARAVVEGLQALGASNPLRAYLK